jgi:PAS domain S-box-containing protein
LFAIHLVRYKEIMPSDSNTGFLKKNNRWLMIFVGLLLLIIVVLVAFSFYLNEKNQRILSPLKDAVRYVELEATEVHQWVESLLERQEKINFDHVWFLLDLSTFKFREMLEDDDEIKKSIIPDDLVKGLTAALEGLDDDIAAYKAAVIWQADHQTPPSITTSEDHDYEHHHADILARLDNIDNLIQLYFQKDMRLSRYLTAGAIALCFLLAGTIGMTFRRFLKQKADHYSALDSAYDELKNEVNERKLAEEQLAQSETLFRTVFETSPDAVVITRIEDSIIVDVNDGFTTYTGYDRGEVIGRAVPEIDIWQDLDQRKVLLDEVLKKGFANNWEAVFRTKAGDFITCLVSTKKTNINGEPHLLAVIRDITDRKISEKMIQAANKFLRITNRHTSMGPMLKEFIAEVKELTQCSAAAIRIMDREGNIPYAEAEGFSTDFCALEGNLSLHSDNGMCVRVIKNNPDGLTPYFTRKGSYFVNSTSALLSGITDDQKKILRNACQRYGYESLALIPIRSGNTTLGLIQVADREPDAFTTDEVTILESAALQLGTAIQRVCAEQALKVSHDELEIRVAQRTEMLQRAKDQLVIEVEERKKKEQELLGYQQRLRHLSSELLQTEERERRRIATEIHDRIGQSLAVNKIQLGSLQAEIDSQDLKTKIEDIRELLSQTIRDTRTLTFELSPPVLYELGLQAALEWLAEIVRKQSGLKVDVAGDGSDQRLDAEKRVLLFRICRELLFNVVRHAGANRARLSLRGDGAAIMVKISDDGRGFDPDLLRAGYDPFKRGFGLFSIREQLQHHGGMFEVDPTPGCGSVLTIVMPLTIAADLAEEV